MPNDTLLDMDENRLAVITGPNMAGKSTYMRQVALIVLLAQTGSFVPADSAVIGITDRIFTRLEPPMTGRRPEHIYGRNVGSGSNFGECH